MQFGFDKSLNIQKGQSEGVNQKMDRQYIGYKKKNKNTQTTAQRKDSNNCVWYLNIDMYI